MSIPLAISQLLEVEARRNTGILSSSSSLAIGLSRVGGVPNDQNGQHGERIVAGTLAELLAQPEDVFGEPLHSLVIVGRKLHPLEVEFAEVHAVDRQRWREVAREVYGCVFD